MRALSDAVKAARKRRRRQTRLAEGEASREGGEMSGMSPRKRGSAVLPRRASEPRSRYPGDEGSRRYARQRRRERFRGEKAARRDAAPEKRTPEVPRAADLARHAERPNAAEVIASGLRPEDNLVIVKRSHGRGEGPAANG